MGGVWRNEGGGGGDAGKVLQIVNVRFKAQFVQNISSQLDNIIGIGAGQHMIDFVPKSNTSKFNVCYRWLGEFGSGILPWNSVVNLLIDGSRAFEDQGFVPVSKGLAVPVITYHNNRNSTLEYINYSTVVGSLAKGVSVNFSTAVFCDVAGVLYTNRTVGGLAGIVQSETGESEMIITEVESNA